MAGHWSSQPATHGQANAEGSTYHGRNPQVPQWVDVTVTL